MSQHTPGLWTAYLQKNAAAPRRTVVGAGDYGAICATAGFRPHPEENEANALLIAAAPEMLTLIREIAGGYASGETMNAARALLAKIEGR